MASFSEKNFLIYGDENLHLLFCVNCNQLRHRIPWKFSNGFSRVYWSLKTSYCINVLGTYTPDKKLEFLMSSYQAYLSGLLDPNVFSLFSLQETALSGKTVFSSLAYNLFRFAMCVF